jgi:precorrin-2 dehydrogenase/sirohydrochlorin ferrochelatase
VDFPVNLRLSGRSVLIVGGGIVALRKARALARAGAKLAVVAPSVTTGFPDSAAIHRRPFKKRDLDGAFLVLCATDDEALNRRVAKACAKRGILVNVVDRPALCTFTYPSVLRRGPLTLAVSTDGESPALAKAMRRELERLYPARSFARLAKLLGAARKRLPPGPDRMRLFARFANAKLLELARGGRLHQIRERLHQLVDRREEAPTDAKGRDRR